MNGTTITESYTSLLQILPQLSVQ